jgi:hypothetical protein
MICRYSILGDYVAQISDLLLRKIHLLDLINILFCSNTWKTSRRCSMCSSNDLLKIRMSSMKINTNFLI